MSVVAAKAKTRLHTLAQHFLQPQNIQHASAAASMVALVQRHQSMDARIEHAKILLQHFITYMVPKRYQRQANNYLRHFYLTLKQKKKRLNMIEILIAISIIVTFTGLTGTVFVQRYEESRVANAKLDLARIQEALVMYFTRNVKYPLQLEELLENGDLNKIPKDPWGQDYLYVPNVDWNRLARLLSTKASNNAQQVEYFIESLKRMKTALAQLPESIDPIQILALANDQPFSICIGSKLPLFPSKIDTFVSREKIKTIAQLMKSVLDRSTAIPELNEPMQELIQYIKK